MNSKVDKPFDCVGSVPAGEAVAGGQFAHTQLVGQATIVGAVQAKAVQKVPEKRNEHVVLTHFISSYLH